MSIQDISSAIRDVVDFPKPGIIFKDITPMLQDAKLFAHLVEARNNGKTVNHVINLKPN